MTDTCPNCDKPYSHQTASSKLKIEHEEAEQARTCVVLVKMDGDVRLGIYFHTHGDLVEPTGPDTGDLSGERETVYEIIAEADGSVIMAEVLKRAMERDVSPKRTRLIVKNLVKQGYVDEVTDAVYKVED